MKTKLMDQIIKKAKSGQKRIVLPESGDERILKAANQIASMKIAKLVLVGKNADIIKKCTSLHIKLSKEIKIVEPEADKEPLAFSAELLAEGIVDGMVTGATHPSADTYRVGFKKIGIKKGFNTVSTYFLIEWNGAEYFFSDCALNINPSAAQLAEIAISTFDSAKSLGFKPKVAMLSFSTKGSAQHELVQKIIDATNYVKAKRKDILIDGELQLDAAIDEKANAMKAKQSIIKGNANVLIFPNLDAANITYKAVRFFGKALSIGPISQGFAKPLNDLSRNCTVEEIIGVVAITAVQAREMENSSSRLH